MQRDGEGGVQLFSWGVFLGVLSWGVFLRCFLEVFLSDVVMVFISVHEVFMKNG